MKVAEKKKCSMKEKRNILMVDIREEVFVGLLLFFQH